MPENVDPSGNTQMFRAFVESPEPDAEPSSKLPLVIGIAVVAAVLLVGFGWLALS